VKIAADESAPSFEEALRCLHEAFNRKLGRAVLNEDIAAFLQKYPVFDGKQKDIKRFFEISDQHFFGNGLSPSGIKDNLSFVTSFAAAMRRSEWSAGFRRANDSGRQGIESNVIESTQSAWLKR